MRAKPSLTIYKAKTEVAQTNALLTPSNKRTNRWRFM